MKIGIFTDIHNNISALEALLSHFQTEGCEEYICCGDIIGIVRGGILTLDQGSYSYRQIEIPYAVSEVIAKINTLKYPDYQIVKKIFYGVS